MNTLLAIDTGLEATGQAAGYGGAVNTSVAEVIGQAINAGLGLLGIVFLALLVYGGIIWLTAAGDKDKVKKATSMLVNSAIAMVFIVGAYALAQFVLNALVTAVS